MRISLGIVRLSWAAWLLAVTGAQSAIAAAPKKLTDADMSALRKEHLRHRQAAFAVEGGWRARNLQQNWSTYFDGRGFEVTPGNAASWRWGLKLTSYGYRGQETRVGSATPAADVDKFSYQWDSILREWYINGEGLEHGYTLAERPGKGAGLRFHLEVRGTLEARVSADGRNVAFGERKGGPAVVNYTGLKVTDAAGRELAARFEVDAPGLRLDIDDSDAQYPITVDPTAQEAYLKASNPDTNDQFGFSVGVDGDLAVVGAPGEQSNGTSEANNSLTAAGAAYVYYRAASGWTQVAYLKAVNPAPAVGDRFGYSVAISGQTIAVGAWGRSAIFNQQTRPNSGAVYVFKLIPCIGGGGCLPTNWLQQAYLEAYDPQSKVVNPQPTDHFGFSVAIHGDTLVAGAPTEDGAAESDPDSGAAYVYSRSGTVWTWQAFLKAPNPLPGVNFGQSVGVSGNTVIIGEPKELAPVGGRAHVFTGTGGVWTLQSTLAASNAGAGDAFGSSVAIDGDTAVVGAPGEDSNGTSQADNSSINSGAAYMFHRSAGQWSQQDYLKASSPIAGEQFGFSVAQSGDVTVVGVPGVGILPGTAYVFRSGVRTQINASNADAADRFGCSVAVGGGTIAVGACDERGNGTSPADNSLVGAGAAYVFIDPKTLVSISINAPFVSIPKGTTDQFTATGTYSDSSSSDLTSQVTWNSSSPSVTITAAGSATGAAVGSSNVTASMNGVTSNTFVLTVLPPALTFINISAPNTQLPGGTTEQFTATGTYSDSSVANITSQVTWFSGNTAAVTISNTGVATAVALGSSTITAAMSGITSNSFTLTVLCATDATASMNVTRGAPTFNFVTGRFNVPVSVRNAGTFTYTGPLALVVDSLSANATLFSPNGSTACNVPAGSPYLDRTPANNALSPGQSVSFVLQFTNPSSLSITFSTRVLAGPNPR